MVTLVSLDLETTGLSVEHDHITQIGVSVSTRSEDGILIHCGDFEKLVQCDGEISNTITKLTGITTAMVSGADCLKSVMGELITFMDRVCPPGMARILVAYNGVKFDVPLLVANLIRVGPGYLADSIRAMKLAHVLDPLPMVRAELDPVSLPRTARGAPSFRLGNVYRCVVGSKLDNAHTALADAKAVLSVLGSEQCAEWCYDAYLQPFEVCINNCRQRVQGQKRKRVSGDLVQIIKSQKSK